MAWYICWVVTLESQGACLTLDFEKYQGPQLTWRPEEDIHYRT